LQVSVLERIASRGILGIGVVEKPEHGPRVAEALLAGGVDCFEIPLRTARAPEAIRLMSRVPGILPGAGTVLTVEQVRIALDSGARFIVSPGVDRDVLAYCAENDIPAIPGVATATDIQACLRFGLRLLKLFPAGALGGPAYLTAVVAPFPGVKIVAVGGVTGANLGEYIRLPSVAACAGSWLTPPDLIASCRFEEITVRAAQAMRVVAETRG